jgi:hypothetical protein
VPDGPAPLSARPDYAVAVGAARPGEWRGRFAWDDRDEVVVWVTDYIKQLGRGECPTQRGYLARARSQVVAPWPKSFGRHGGWVAARDTAQERLR